MKEREEKSVGKNLGKIGILMGGTSTERDVSLASGQAVYETLRDRQCDVMQLDVTTEDKQQVASFIKESKISVAFIALHGRFGEDGTVQEILDSLRIPYTGSGVTASQLAMDKIASHKLFQEQGLSVPNYAVLSRLKTGFSYDPVQSQNTKDFKDFWGFYKQIASDLIQPIVVKPAAQGSSIGLSIVDGEVELRQAINYAFDFDDRIIVEEYIPGREITVGILGDLALPVVEIIPKNKFYDYEAKYTLGMSSYVVPANLSPQATACFQDIAMAANESLGCSGF